MGRVPEGAVALSFHFNTSRPIAGQTILKKKALAQSQPPRAQYLKEIPCSWHWPAALFRTMKSTDSFADKSAEFHLFIANSPLRSPFATFWRWLGFFNVMVLLFGTLLLMLAAGFKWGNDWGGIAVYLIISGLLGAFAFLTIAAVVQHLCNIDYRLNSNNKLLSQLLRAYGHEPEV